MKLVKILRGLPGSGKTHYTDLFRPTRVVCSADHHQVDDGVYNFKPERARDAHRLCFTDFINALEIGQPLIIVDNTNTDPVEIAPYYKMAEHYYYDVEIVWFKTPLEVCMARQTHGVPISTMCNMYWNLKKELPRWWIVTEITG
jgi:predicted kinase